MSIPISGILLDPYGNVARFADIKMVTLVGSGDVIETANSTFRTDENGAYSIDVQFGRFAVYMRFNGNNGSYEKIQAITVNSDTIASTLGELLAYTEPLTPDEILIVQALVNEAVAAKDLSQAAALSAGLDADSAAVSEINAQSSATAAANSVALLAPVPLNGGVWASGQTFTAYNQYMIFGGEAYSARQETPLPYIVGASPDLGFVYQIKLNSLQALSGLTEPSDLTHNTLSGINDVGAHVASSISLAVKGAMAENPVSLQDAIDWHGIFVEEFRQAGFSDSQTINAALSYIGALPYTGTKLIFESGKTYNYDSTHSLGLINRMCIDLNGATLKRVAGSTTATTLNAIIGIGQSTITVVSIPANWQVGEYLTAFSDNTNANTSQNAVRIVSLTPATNTVVLASGFGVFGAFTTTIPSGTTVAKSFACFAGRPSSPDSTTPLAAGINDKIFIVNGTIDGNRANQLNGSWRFISEIGLHSSNGLITNMTFKEIGGETIVGHGLRVQGNKFHYVNGSCFHTSLNDLQIEEVTYSHFCDNVLKNVNQAGNAVVGHSEGAITFSWGAGNLVVSGNIAKNGVEGFLGDFGSVSEPHADRLLIVTDNIVEDFARIGRFVSDSHGVVVDDNVWSNCGDNSAQVLQLKKNPAAMFGNSNLAINGTLLNNISKATHVATLSDWKNYSTNIRDYVQKNPIATTMSYTINDAKLVEDADAAFSSLLTSNTGIAGHTYYKETGSEFGEYFSFINHNTNVYRRAFNQTNGRQEFGRSGASTQLVLDEQGEVQLTDFLGFYLGNKDVDGCWRFINSGADLLIQKRVGGTYVTKQTITG